MLWVDVEKELTVSEGFESVGMLEEWAELEDTVEEGSGLVVESVIG